MRGQRRRGVAVLVWLCQTLRPDLVTLSLLENAGSMRGLRKDYWRAVWQASPAAVQALDAAAWSAATRDRLFLSPWPAIPVTPPTPPPRPWDPGWALHPWRTRAPPPRIPARGLTPCLLYSPDSSHSLSRFVSRLGALFIVQDTNL